MQKVFFLSLLFILTQTSYAQEGHPSSWSQVKSNGKGNITIYWETSIPFIYTNAQGDLEGIEYELIESFRKFLNDHYDVNVSTIWKKASSFDELVNKTREQNNPGTFAVSALSITPERKQHMSFSPPYMSDITVLISSKNTPIVTSPTEFDQIFGNLTAITIKGTTYEHDLKRLKNARDLDFDMLYIHSSKNILTEVGKQENTFGYIDLPIYLRTFKNNTSLGVKRQNLYPLKRKGYGIAYPQHSDWDEPLEAYFADEESQKEIKAIISKYLDNEVYDFIESYYEDNISLLTKEKELQKRDLMSKTEQIEQDTSLKYALVFITIITLTFAVVVFLMYRKRNKVAIQLEEQKQKIESQRINITRQKVKLRKRDELMTSYNDEKNNLIKILAHDLRTPINHILGLANIYKMENPELKQSNAEIIGKIVDSSDRLLKMISKILDVDAIEANRVNMLQEKINLVEVVDKVVNIFSKDAMAKELVLTVVKNIPEATIQADPLYLTEIIENLLSNAIKFSSKGEKITVSLNREEDNFVISVADEGPGLSAEDKKHLFQKFQTLSAKPTAGEQSTGLGLSIVKKYVELMGGKVWCESDLGKGATFNVSFKAV